MFSRREFLKGLLVTAALASLEPGSLLAAPKQGEPLLVAVHLTGGNDALNTLVPYKNELYRRARPNLALGNKNLLSTENNLALHPSLGRLHQRFQQGEVRFFTGIGREDHDRSHFRSSDIWHSLGRPGEEGWMATLSKRLDCVPVSLGPSISQAVACPDHPPVGLVGDRPTQLPGDEKLHQAWFDMYRNWKTHHPAGKRLKSSAAVVEELTEKLERKMMATRPPVPFGGDDFGKRFELAYRLVASGFPAKTMHLSVGKFDTHSGQLGSHAQQLEQFDRASQAFLQNLERLNRPTVLMVYSEFGRRVSENFSGGTDHGAGGLAWLMGKGVKGGIVGDYRLETLRDGDISTQIPYQELYRDAVGSAFGAEQAGDLFTG